MFVEVCGQTVHRDRGEPGRRKQRHAGVGCRLPSAFDPFDDRNLTRDVDVVGFAPETTLDEGLGGVREWAGTVQDALDVSERLGDGRRRRQIEPPGPTAEVVGVGLERLAVSTRKNDVHTAIERLSSDQAPDEAVRAIQKDRCHTQFSTPARLNGRPAVAARGAETLTPSVVVSDARSGR